MQIREHKLVEAEWNPAADIRGPIAPKAIVLHYTAGGTAVSSVNWLSRDDETYVSAHIVIGRDGHVFQLGPLNRRALHAGVSQWQGRENLNNWSIGIELANWGLVTRNGASYVSWAGHPVSALKVQEATHKSGLRAYWEAYPGVQVLSLIEVCKALTQEYGIGTIVGHDDVSPGRKVDPGPLLDMEELRAEVFNPPTPISEGSVVDTGGEGTLLNALCAACKQSPILRDAAVHITEAVKE